MSEVPRSSNPWLYGPLPDLLFGCGVLYALACLLFAFEGGAVFHAIPLFVPVVLVALISMPHYGATLLRVYDRREDRRGYFLFSVVATGILVALMGVALFDRFTGSVIATVYLTWAGWHYTGQNYGIASMFLRRRGVAIDGPARQLLYASFTLSFLIVFLVMHGQEAPLADPSREVRLIPLAIPKPVNALAIPLVVSAYLATPCGGSWLLGRRAGRLGDLVPTLLISGTQALWWSVPYLARYFGWLSDSVPLGWDGRGLFFPWIACSHALQYLWITSYYARSSSGWSGQLRYYALVLVAGSALWTLPALAFAPGPNSFDWNFALLLAATINIHHFVLDGAIWKLRNTKIAGILIADVDEGAAEERRGGVVRKVVWAVAIFGLAVNAHSFLERFVIEKAAQRRGDLEAVAASLDRQSWLGTGKSYRRYRLARAFEKQGKVAAAIEQYEISADMEPRVESIKRLIAYYQQTGEAAGFVRSCDRLFELDSVERPMATPDSGTLGERVPKAFWQACVASARAARPETRVAADPTGGAGLDGGRVPEVGYTNP